MPYSFQSAERDFRAHRIRDLSSDLAGLRFLKLRSLSRKEHLNRLIQDHNLTIPAGRTSARLNAVFDSLLADIQIDATIRAIYSEERQVRAANEAGLISELYKLPAFNWGGLHQNSLERTIIDNYVKKISSYEELRTRIDNELFHSLQSYVLSSWYNHWTSIIIEDIFRDHPRVLPAVGLIKQIDFFINDVPYDLKVTYLPEGFIKEQRKGANLKEELSILKKFCRSQQLHYDHNLPSARLLEDLWRKVSDHPSAESRAITQELETQRLTILQQAEENPTDLIRWLYENQGVRRFDASNRLFLVLTDCNNFFESWKLKRAKPLLVDKIHQHLSETTRAGYNLEFHWENEIYSATSDVIFVTHNRC